MKLMEDLSCELDTSFPLGACETLFVFAHLLELPESRSKLACCDKPLLTVDMPLTLLVKQD